MIIKEKKYNSYAQPNDIRVHVGNAKDSSRSSQLNQLVDENSRKKKKKYRREGLFLRVVFSSVILYSMILTYEFCREFF